MAWLSIKAMTAMTGKSRVFQNDAPLSVLRSFTEAELGEFRRLAGLPEMHIARFWPFRWVLKWRQPWESGFPYPGAHPAMAFAEK